MVYLSIPIDKNNSEVTQIKHNESRDSLWSIAVEEIFNLYNSGYKGFFINHCNTAYK